VRTVAPFLFPDSTEPRSIRILVAYKTLSMLSIKSISILALISLVLFACDNSEVANKPADEKAVKEAIQNVYDQAILAWNNRDMAGYMGMYWQSEQFRTISGDAAYYGWQKALDMSVASDPDGVYMDPSYTDDFQIEVFNDSTAYTLTLWRTQNDSLKTTGASTDLWKLKPEGWRIVHSHISYAGR
jgi:hypothetical protein